MIRDESLEDRTNDVEALDGFTNGAPVECVVESDSDEEEA